MTELLQLMAIILAACGLWLLLEWQGNRITRQMIDGIKTEQARSRPAPGFDVAPDIAPQASAVTRVGVEPASGRAAAPPAPQNLVGAASPPPQAAPTRTRVLLSPHSLGGRRVIQPPTSSALAGLDRWCPQ